MHRFIGLCLVLALAACDTQTTLDTPLAPGTADAPSSSAKAYTECYDYTYSGQRLLNAIGGGAAYTNYNVDEHLEVGAFATNCDTDGVSGQIVVRGLGSFASSDPSAILHHVTVRVYVNNTLVHSYNSGSTVPSQTAGLTTTTFGETLDFGDKIKAVYYYEVETNNEVYQKSLTRQFTYGA